MLLANMSVAKIVADAFPDRALLRRHPPPDEKKLSAVLDLAKSLVQCLPLMSAVTTTFQHGTFCYLLISIPSGLL